MVEVNKLDNFGINVVHRFISIENQKYRQNYFLMWRYSADRILAYRPGLHAWNAAFYRSHKIFFRWAQKSHILFCGFRNCEYPRTVLIRLSRFRFNLLFGLNYIFGMLETALQTE